VFVASHEPSFISVVAERHGCGFPGVGVRLSVTACGLQSVNEIPRAKTTTVVSSAVSDVGLAIAIAAVVGMLIGAILATAGAIARRRRLGLIGVRLCLGGPGLTSIAMGLFLVGLPWPQALIALLPVFFGAFLLRVGLGPVTPGS